MQKIVFLVLSLVMITLFVACKKEVKEQTLPPKETDSLSADVSKVIQVIFPPNTNVELAACEVYSLSYTSGVNEDGRSRIGYSKGYPSIAYLFDKENNVLLAGFITDTTGTISVATTAEVLLYLGMGTNLLPYEVRDRFISGIGQVPGVPEWKQELETIFKSDPLMLEKGLFASALKTRVAAIIGSGEILRRPAEVTVDAADTRSGLQLAEHGLNQFTITNSYRRRSEAFVYKMNGKDLKGNPFTVNANISGSDTAIAKLKISSTNAIRDFKGVLQDWAAGKGMEFAAATFGPVEIPLEDDEKEVNFKVRVVGPGMAVNGMTTNEVSTLKKLNYKTIAFDYIIPVMLDIIGHKEVTAASTEYFKNNLKVVQGIIEKTSNAIAAVPAAADALDGGNYWEATKAFFTSLINGQMGTAADEWIEFLYEKVGEAVKDMGGRYINVTPEDMVNRGKSLIKVLKISDLVMKFVDYSRITYDFAKSNTMEEWDLSAKELELTLDPHAFSIGPLAQRKLTTHIKADLGSDPPVIEYEWNTTGKYGYLWDDRGHKGDSFSSSIKEAYYLCNAEEKDLGAGQHIDTIKVTVYIKKGQTRTKVGSDVCIVNITTNTFTIGLTPDIGIKSRDDGHGHIIWSYGPPSYWAEFVARPGARGYVFRSVRPDGTMSNPDRPILKTRDGKLRYQINVGYLRFGDYLTEEEIAPIRISHQKLLDDYPFNAIEVTVEY